MNDFTRLGDGVRLPLSIILLAYVILFIKSVVFSVDNNDYNQMVFQIVLITSLLMVYIYENQSIDSRIVRFRARHALILLIFFSIPFLEMFLSYLFPGEVLRIQKLEYSLSLVILVWTILWSIPRTLARLDVMQRQDANLISILFGAMVGLVFICIYNIAVFFAPEYQYGLSVELVMFLIIAVLFYSIVHYLISLLRSQTRQSYAVAQYDLGERDPGKPWRPVAELRELLEMVVRIEHELEKNRLYLDPCVSLDILSEKTQIPKHKLSQVFNTYFKKGFYQLIGEYRVHYAREYLSTNGNISMDGLSEICGFNSKTTFYKYFKKVNGCTPHEFVQSIKNNPVSSHRNVLSAKIHG